jgi:hypothetical protein
MSTWAKINSCIAQRVQCTCFEEEKTCQKEWQKEDRAAGLAKARAKSVGENTLSALQKELVKPLENTKEF